MNIAYLDFNDELVESYVTNSKAGAYGGGRVFASIAKEALDNFFIFANPECFKHLAPDEKKKNCIGLNSEQRARIRAGEPVKDIIPFAEEFDLFVHHQVCHHVNIEGLKAKECCWAVGYGEPIHPQNEHLLLYNNFQSPQVTNPETKVYKIVIGKEIPEFQEYNKENFIFQCTRHCEQFNSINVAILAKHFGVPVYFAGPIGRDYPLLHYVDNQMVHYLGIISEETKIDYLKRAKMSTFIHTWPTPFSLSAIEALSYGTPILATNVGFWPSLVNGLNGDHIVNFAELPRFFNKDYKQWDCFESALPYSSKIMLNNFTNVFEEILNEKD